MIVVFRPRAIRAMATRLVSGSFEGVAANDRAVAEAVQRSFRKAERRTIRAQGARIMEPIGEHAYRVKADDDLKVRGAFVSPNYVFTTTALPNDSSFNRLWGLNQTNDIDMNAPEAWDLGSGSDSQVVAVIDTGILYTHPDLTANMWRNPGEIPGNGVDDDSNGFVDDVHGMNAVRNSGDPLDDNGHGTHCAGTIGAVGNNTAGVAGVNWRVKLMALKFLDASGRGDLGGAIQAINYMNMMKERGVNVRVSSNSWGAQGAFSQALQSAIRQSSDLGILFVAAAGNNSSDNDSVDFYPANFDLPNVVSVAAVDRNGRLASFSNYGARKVDIAAPGVGIYSTYLNSGYTSLDGTSMATPHVAGAASLVLSVWGQTGMQDLRRHLLSQIKPLSSVNGKMVNAGIPNLRAALATNPAPDDPTPTPTATPSPPVSCTPVACPPPGRLVCPPNAACEGGCGMVCMPPPPQCTPVACPPPGNLVCPTGDCQGGCGMVCAQPPTPTPTVTPTTPPPPQCTPVACPFPGRLVCIRGADCSNGCNRICVRRGAPVIRRQPPGEIVVREGEPLIIRGASVQGIQPMRYLWEKREGQSRGTINRPSLIIRRARVSDSGTYYCSVSNPLGSAITSDTVVTVLPRTIEPPVTPPPTDPGPSQRIFVTSSSFAGNFGGVARADSICQQHASASGLGGQWKAILSDRTTSASERISITLPVVDLRGRLIAEDASDLWDGEIGQRINVTEQGQITSQHLVWTGTRSNGQADRRELSSTCNNWSSTSGAAETGRTDRSDSGWIAIYDQGDQPANACSNPGALYCIEQFGPTIPAHRIFVSSTAHAGDFGGLGVADAVCRRLATAAGIGGQWKAVLSDRRTNARDRLSIIGRIVDMQGNLVASSAQDLWDGSVLTNVSITERGRRIGPRLIWSGTRSDGTRDTRIGTTCNNWTSTSGGAETGRTDRSDFGWLAIYDRGDQASNACSNDGSIYCLEQFNDEGLFPRD